MHGVSQHNGDYELLFSFHLNSSSKANSTTITTVSKGMVNFRVRIDAAGSMSYVVSLYKDGGNPTFTIGTVTTWTVSGSNTVDFNAYFNSNVGTSSMTISNAVIMTTYQTGAAEQSVKRTARG